MVFCRTRRARVLVLTLSACAFLLPPPLPAEAAPDAAARDLFYMDGQVTDGKGSPLFRAAVTLKLLQPQPPNPPASALAAIDQERGAALYFEVIRVKPRSKIIVTDDGKLFTSLTGRAAYFLQIDALNLGPGGPPLQFTPLAVRKMSEAAVCMRSERGSRCALCDEEACYPIHCPKNAAPPPCAAGSAPLTSDSDFPPADADEDTLQLIQPTEPAEYEWCTSEGACEERGALTAAAPADCTHPATIIKYGADWCGPCQAFDAALPELRLKYPCIKFVLCNIERPAAGCPAFPGGNIPQIYWADRSKPGGLGGKIQNGFSGTLNIYPCCKYCACRARAAGAACFDEKVLLSAGIPSDQWGPRCTLHRDCGIWGTANCRPTPTPPRCRRRRCCSWPRG